MYTSIGTTRYTKEVARQNSLEVENADPPKPLICAITKSNMSKASIFIAIALAGAVSADSVCTINPGGACTGTCTLSTATPTKGGNFTVTISGSCTEDITVASYVAKGTYAGLPVLNHVDDACSPSDFPVGGVLNLGHFYIGGATCPVAKAGTVTISSVAHIAKACPSGTLKAGLVAYDAAGGKGNVLFDISLDVAL